MRAVIEVGILISTEGTYRYMAESALAGMRHALAEINAEPCFPYTLNATHINPAGNLSAHSAGVEWLISASG